MREQHKYVHVFAEDEEAWEWGDSSEVYAKSYVKFRVNGAKWKKNTLGGDFFVILLAYSKNSS